MSDYKSKKSVKGETAKSLTSTSSSSSESDDSSHSYQKKSKYFKKFQYKGPRKWGRFGTLFKKRKVETSNADEDEVKPGPSTVQPNASASPSASASGTDTDLPVPGSKITLDSEVLPDLTPPQDDDSFDPEDLGPPMQMEAQPDPRDYWPSDLMSDSESQGAASSGTPTVAYRDDSVKYTIGLQGTLKGVADFKTENEGLQSAIAQLLQMKVSNNCQCYVDKAPVYDPINLGKLFADHKNTYTVKCVNPNTCNKIDITGANYVAEREKSAKDIMRLRNRSIAFGDEEHYYMGEKIKEYIDIFHNMGEIFLHAKMGEEGKSLRMFRKDAVVIFLVR